MTADPGRATFHQRTFTTLPSVAVTLRREGLGTRFNRGTGGLGLPIGGSAPHPIRPGVQEVTGACLLSLCECECMRFDQEECCAFAYARIHTAAAAVATTSDNTCTKIT